MNRTARNVVLSMILLSMTTVFFAGCNKEGANDPSTGMESRVEAVLYTIGRVKDELNNPTRGGTRRMARTLQQQIRTLPGLAEKENLHSDKVQIAKEIKEKYEDLHTNLTGGGASKQEIMDKVNEIESLVKSLQ